MDNYGQSAIEYLLLIGGAVLVAAIVLAILVKTTGVGKQSAEEATTSYTGEWEKLHEEIETTEE